MNPMQELLQAIEAIRFDKTTPQVTQIWFQFWSENEDGSFICTSDREILNYDSHGDYIDEPIYLPTVIPCPSGRGYKVAQINLS